MNKKSLCAVYSCQAITLNSWSLYLLFNKCCKGARREHLKITSEKNMCLLNGLLSASTIPLTNVFFSGVNQASTLHQQIMNITFCQNAKCSNRSFFPPSRQVVGFHYLIPTCSEQDRPLAST